MGEEDKAPESSGWTMGEDDFKRLMEGQQKTHQAVEQTGEALEATNKTISEMDTGMQLSMTEMGSDIKHIKERATEDRESAKSTETELENKVGTAHQHVNAVGTRVDTLQGKFEAHDTDNNRHSGTAPGGAGRTAVIAGGSLAGGGVLVVIVKMIIDALAG